MSGRVWIYESQLVPLQCKDSQILLEDPVHADEDRTIISLEAGA